MKIVYYNGNFLEEEKIKISLNDRGYQFGDGVYEVIRFYEGNFFKLKEHLERYKLSLKKIDIKMDFDIKKIENDFNNLIKLSNVRNGYVYTQISRGVSPRNHLYTGEELEPQFIAYVERAERPLKQMKEGCSAILEKDERWLKCDIKSLNLLGSLLVKNKAKRENSFEAILHRNGYITEGSVSNVFVCRNQELYTTPSDNLILNGITRLTVIDIAKELGIVVREMPFLNSFLLEAEEVFTTATVSEITPIIEIKNIGKIGNGIRGEITKKIQEKYSQMIKNLR